ncbi:MAG: heme o synthase [Planctomycetes bacterium]|nr:heme o synthase [Planctomycetota bacterium]MCW8136591.1 heme o synthase [Planctomycetota bacterium]
MKPEAVQLSRWQTAAYRLAQACVLLVLFMIAVGAMVTTIRAGDTNPGWSWRFWEWITTWWSSQGGRAYEDGHRVIGTVVGFAGIGLAVAMYKGERGGRRWLGVIALALISLQGLLGGLRVLVVSDENVRETVLSVTGGGYDVELRRAVKAMIHGVTAQVIFASLACIAVVTSPRWHAAWSGQKSPAAGGTRRLALAACALITGQLALGTLVRQTGEHVLLHVFGACTVTLTILWLLLRVFRHHGSFAPLRRLGGALGVMLMFQVFLGITPWMLTAGELVSHDPASPVALMRTAHVTLGALILASASVLALWLHRLVLPANQEERATSTAAGFEYTLGRRLRDLWVLTKARLSALVMVTVASGYLLATRELPNVVHMSVALLGVACVALGVAALNQYLERERDARMERTRDRPVAAGRMAPAHALVFGAVTVLGGSLALLLWVNWLSALLTFATAAIYVGVYTPLKTRTTINTLVGAVPGALPPVIGWAAATGTITLHAFVLFAILYVWQLPHFWSIARLYREDYERGGMKMLSVADRDGRFIAGQIALWCVALIVTSFLPVLVGMAGGMYAGGALALGLAFLAAGLVNLKHQTRATTRGVFFASLLYLPLLLAVLIADVW